MAELERALEAGGRRRGRPGEPAQRGACELGRRRGRGVGVERGPVLDEQRAGGLVEHGLLVDELRRRAQQVLVGGGVQAAERGHEIEARADAREAAIVVRGVVAPGDARGCERRPHLVAPELEQRPHAAGAVARRQRAEGGAPGRAREAVEDRLDAIVARVARRDRAARRELVGSSAAQIARAALEVGPVLERRLDARAGQAELVGQRRHGLGVAPRSRRRAARGRRAARETS